MHEEEETFLRLKNYARELTEGTQLTSTYYLMYGSQSSQGFQQGGIASVASAPPLAKEQLNDLEDPKAHDPSIRTWRWLSSKLDTRYPGVPLV